MPMIQPKIKAKVEIALTEDNLVVVSVTSKNNITNLGMVEVGKSILLSKPNVEDQSNIVIPRLVG